MNSPFNCKECSKRSHKCHATCDKYLEAKAEWERIKALGKPYQDYKAYNAEVSYNNSIKNVKRKKKHEGYQNFRR